MQNLSPAKLHEWIAYISTSLLIAGIIAGISGLSDLRERLVTLEVREHEYRDSLRKIENKVDQILERGRK